MNITLKEQEETPEAERKDSESKAWEVKRLQGEIELLYGGLNTVSIASPQVSNKGNYVYRKDQ
jgi:hypothetical protein